MQQCCTKYVTHTSVNTDMSLSHHTILEHIFYTIHHVRDLILDNLCASDCALMFAVMKHEPMDYDVKKYLQVENEVPEYKPWITNMIKSSYNVLVIGSDVEYIVDKIKDPLRFWKVHPKPVHCNLFIIAVKVIEHCNENWSQVIEALSPNYLSLKPSDGWKCVGVSSDSRVSVLSYYHNTIFTGMAFFDIGATYRYNHIRVWDSVSSALISQTHSEQFATKYIDLSQEQREIQNVTNNSLSYKDVVGYPCIDLMIHVKDYYGKHDTDIISFVVGK